MIFRLFITLVLYGLACLTVTLVMGLFITRGRDPEFGSKTWLGTLAFDSFALSGVLAFIVLTVQVGVAESGVLGSIGGYAVGALAAFLAFVINGLSWRSIANLYFLSLTVLGYSVFSIWPVVARFLCGWLFAVFGN